MSRSKKSAFTMFLYLLKIIIRSFTRYSFNKLCVLYFETYTGGDACRNDIPPSCDSWVFVFVLTFLTTYGRYMCAP